MCDGSGGLAGEVGIIGAGSLARALAPYLTGRGVAVSGVWARDAASGRRLARAAKIRFHGDPGTLVAASRVVVLAVSDDAIPAVARLVVRFPIDGRLVIHASGCASLASLAPALDAGAVTAVVHPLMTMVGRRGRPGGCPRHTRPGLPERGGVNPLARAPMGVACSSRRTGACLEKWLRGQGHPVFRLPPGDRARYHAGAVLACAGLFRLFRAAARLIGRDAGLPETRARRLLEPMAAAALRLAAEGRGDVISGPWSRSDAGTVRRHRGALRRGFPEIFRLYETLMNLNPERGERECTTSRPGGR